MPQAQTDARPHVELFTDGSCSGNPGPGGWAFILRDNKTGREIHVADGEARTTNNRMELLGVIKGLERLKEPCRVDLYSDSQYVVFGLKSWMDDWRAKGWKRSVTIAEIHLLAVFLGSCAEHVPASQVDGVTIPFGLKCEQGMIWLPTMRVVDQVSRDELRLARVDARDITGVIPAKVNNYFHLFCIYFLVSIVIPKRQA